MIKSLEVENFKSIRQLKLDCKRINILIGEPNTGKSNILETLGIFSFGAFGESIEAYGKLKDFVRFENMDDLFYDQNIEDPIKIKIDEKILNIRFRNSKFMGSCREMQKEIFSFDYDYNGSGKAKFSRELSRFRFYRFKVKRDFPKKESDFLLPPNGENLFTVLLTHKKLRSTANQLFSPFELRLMFKPRESKIEVVKEYEDILIGYPYFLASETLQRIIFYLTAINTSDNSVLIFEEPESHAFPYCTKYLAEKIALDENENQYFISTHNHYFLLSILEKSPKEDLGIFITYFEDYQTKIKPLIEQDIEEIMDRGHDIFFNIERFLER
ncbi:MAG: ATP/GTP-binding protein [Candidatus Methanofastidiosia archaeon]